MTNADVKVNNLLFIKNLFRKYIEEKEELSRFNVCRGFPGTNP